VNFTFRPDGCGAVAFCGGQDTNFRGLKNRTAAAQITLDFKNFWTVLARENLRLENAETSESNFCTVWLSLKDVARTLAESSIATPC
jgi:hypothetical protein